MRAILSLIFLFVFSSVTQAQIFNAGTDCISPNKEISAKDLMEKLSTSPGVRGCDLYEITYFDIITDVDWSFEDGYEGPTLFIKMISNNGPAKWESAVIAIRADKPLCLVESAPGIESLVYNSEVARGGILEYLSNNTQNFTRQVSFQFTNDQLNLVEQIVNTRSGGAFGESRDSQSFKCGGYTNQGQKPTP